jgi:capsid protein
MVIRSRGLDPSVVDEQQVQERARADQKGLVYDSDPNKTFLHSESAPDVVTTPNPEETDEEEQPAAPPPTNARRPAQRVH